MLSLIIVLRKFTPRILVTMPTPWPHPTFTKVHPHIIHVDLHAFLFASFVLLFLDGGHRNECYLDGLGLVGSEIPDVGYGCVPPGVCVLSRQGYLDQNGRYPCGHLFGPPTSHPATSNLQNWIYPNSTPASYPYHSNLYMPTSFCQMVYPPPMVFGVVQPRMLSPNGNEEFKHTTAPVLPRSNRRSLVSPQRSSSFLLRAVSRHRQRQCRM